MTTYTCNQCGINKPPEMFYADKRNTCKGVIARCKECIKENQRERNKTKAHTEKDYLRKRTWALKNADKVRQQARAKRARNPQAYREATRKWELKYPERKVRHRRGKKIATPEFANQEMMRVVMKKAREYGLEVDHIVPINHPLVCGLHCWHNLQLLSKSLNSAKQNLWWPDMPDNSLSSSELQAITK